MPHPATEPVPQQSPQQRPRRLHGRTGSRPSARSVASSLAIPNRTPLPDTQNNDSRDSAVITPLVDVTKLAAPGNTSTWVATTDAGARSSRTSRTIRLSIDGAPEAPARCRPRPGPVDPSTPSPTTRRWSDPPRCQRNSAARPGSTPPAARSPAVCGPAHRGHHPRRRRPVGVRAAQQIGHEAADLCTPSGSST